MYWVRSFLEHPHRFCHSLAPVRKRPSGLESKLAKNCHQDSYTPLGSPRQHYSRYARIMYYPQDTPVELGPTHVIPGTQFHRSLSDEDRKRAITRFRSGGNRIPYPFRCRSCGGCELAQSAPPYDQVHLCPCIRTHIAFLGLSKRKVAPAPQHRIRLRSRGWSGRICGIGSAGSRMDLNHGVEEGEARRAGGLPGSSTTSSRNYRCRNALTAMGRLAKLRAGAADAIPELIPIPQSRSPGRAYSCNLYSGGDR